MNKQRRFTRSEKRLFVLTGFAIVCIVAFGAWRQYLNAIPEVEIPTPKMPSPNAYDFYVKAGAAIVKANPAVDPAYDSQTVPESQWKTRYPTSAKEAWLKRNATALNLLRQGFKYPCRVPPQRSQSQIPPIPHQLFRDVARLLSVESRVYREHEDWSGATASALDILKFGQDMSQGGNVMDSLVAAVINAIGRRELWEILPHLNVVESKSAVQRLEKDIKKRVSFADVLREEKYHSQAQLLEHMQTQQWQAINIKDSKGWDLPIQLWFGATMTRRTVFDNHTKLMDALIVAAQKPYIDKPNMPTLPKDILSQIMTPVYERARWNYARNDAGNSMLLIALALRAYHLEKNQYPQTLNQLVPRYLKEIPADPFGGGEPLHYKLTGAEYSFYSIGPDGIDNGGRAIEDTKIPKEKRNRFQVKPESKGDMVAGIN